MKSIAHIIKNFNKQKFHYYYLNGDDIFLEKFFTNQIQKKFLNQSELKLIYHLSVDDEDLFLRELQTNSLFDDKKLIVCWEINKLSKKAQNELLSFIEMNPSRDICLVFVAPDFRIKNKFITSLSSRLTNVDIRTPFPNKMKNWIIFYANSNGFKISNELLNFYIDSYGDSLSSVINEIDKHRTYSSSKILDIDDKYSLTLNIDRKYNYWQFLDNIGSKNTYKCFQIYRSLINNNISQNYIVSGLSSLFLSIYSKKTLGVAKKNFYLSNKILSRNLDRYCSNFSEQKLKNIIQELYKIDKMVKTFQFGVEQKIELLILKACYGRR